jgi:hypothetical protein
MDLITFSNNNPKTVYVEEVVNSIKVEPIPVNP